MPPHTSSRTSTATNTPTTARRATGALLAAACVAALPGCLPETEPIQVSLNNRTQTSITARVVLELRSGDAQTLTRTPIPAGESRNLGPFAPPSDGTLQLVVARDNQFSDVPTRRTLKPGSWSWQISTPIFSTYSSIELKDAPTGEGAWEWAPRSMGSVSKSRDRRDF
ncbi:MAG: hypothetical protein ACI89L_000590 [Phycisphaerales bacterium]|jgi:hypothetical protein